MFVSYELFGISSATFDPDRTFVRSSLLSPPWLAFVRLVIAIYCFTTIIVGYTWQAFNISQIHLQDVNIPSYLMIANSVAIGRSFSFFTWLCFWSQAFYFLVSSLHTLCFARRHHTWLHDKFPKPLQLAHNLWYTTVTTFPFLVSIVFWAIMYSGPWPTGRYEQWLNLSVHGLNSLFALIEIIIPATKRPPVSHLAVVLLIMSLYLGLAYLTKATQGFYVYEWMNPDHGKVSIVLHVLGYAGGICMIFVLVSLAFWGRVWIFSTRCAEVGNMEKGQDIWVAEMPVYKRHPEAHVV